MTVSQDRQRPCALPKIVSHKEFKHHLDDLIIQHCTFAEIWRYCAFTVPSRWITNFRASRDRKGLHALFNRHKDRYYPDGTNFLYHGISHIYQQKGRGLFLTRDAFDALLERNTKSHQNKDFVKKMNDLSQQAFDACQDQVDNKAHLWPVRLLYS